MAALTYSIICGICGRTVKDLLAKKTIIEFETIVPEFKDIHVCKNCFSLLDSSKKHRSTPAQKEA